MTDDEINGAKMLLERVDAALSNKRLAADRRLILEIQQYQLKYLVQMRADISRLKRHDVIQWMQENKKLSIVIAILLLIVNSMVNWSGIRKPLLQTLLYQFGIIVPIDAIP